MCTVGVDNSVTIVVENIFLMCPSNKDPLVVYQLNNSEMSHTDSEIGEILGDTIIQHAYAIRSNLKCTINIPTPVP